MFNDPETARIPLEPLGVIGALLIIGGIVSLPVGALLAAIVGGVSPTAFIPGAIMTVPVWVSDWGLAVIAGMILGTVLLLIERTQARNRVRAMKRQRELRERGDRPIWSRPPLE